MKNSFLTAVAASSITASLLMHSPNTHGGEDGFGRWTATHALQLTTVESTGDDADLLPLESAIGAAKVVALGEPMHGAHEPLAFRNRLFRFLVERMGFTAIALEAGFPESIDARSFVEDGEAGAEESGLDGLGQNRYSESLELLRWMRDYNRNAASRGQRTLRIYGIDIPGGGFKRGAKIALDSALSFLSMVDSASAQEIRGSLNDSLPPTNSRELGPLQETEQAEFERSIELIAVAIQKNRKGLIARTSEDKYRSAMHNLDVARQLAKCLRNTPPPGSDMNAWAPTMTCRDTSMAENVRWALKNEGREGRVFVFAHLGHVMAGKADGRRTAMVLEKSDMMGLPLRREYGNDYYIIGMVCASTSGGLVAAKPLEAGSIESTLVAVGLPLMFVDIRKAQQNKRANTWLSVTRSIDANVSAQGLTTLSTAVDAFIFVNTLTPAVRPSP